MILQQSFRLAKTYLDSHFVDPCLSSLTTSTLPARPLTLFLFVVGPENWLSWFGSGESPSCFIWISFKIQDTFTVYC